MRVNRWLVVVALLLAMLSAPAPLRAQDGCNSQACFYSGYYTVWYGIFAYPCAWWYTQYYNGYYSYSDSCGGNYSGWTYMHP
jgi:hypothetical protein